jgi:ribose 5-phosphate isomerase RpiB
MGGRIIGIEKATDLAETFLKSKFSHAERHTRRLKKIELSAFSHFNFFG